VDPITREWYCPQARIPGLLTFRSLGRFRPSFSIAQECSTFATYRAISCLFISRICTCITAGACAPRTILAAIVWSSAAGKWGNAARRRLVRGSRARLGTGGALIHIGVRSICTGIAALALGFALEPVGGDVVGAASAGRRAESALFSVFETIR